MTDLERALEDERRIINAATEEMDMSETSEQVHETQDGAPSFRQKLARMSLDDRVMAWAAICDHPIFDGAHETHEGLLDGMVSKLNYAHRGNTALPLRSAQVEAVWSKLESLDSLAQIEPDDDDYSKGINIAASIIRRAIEEAGA